MILRLLLRPGDSFSSFGCVIDSDDIPHFFQMPQYASGEMSSDSPGGDSPSTNVADGSWAPTPAPRNIKLDALNEFLLKGGLRPVDGQLLKPLQECSISTIRYYKRKAREALNLSLNCIAPHQEEALLQAVLHDKDQIAVSEPSMHSLVECYNEVTSWYTRQQILSIIAKDRAKEQLPVIFRF